MYIFVSCVYSTLRVQKKALDPLEWELQVVVTTIWVLKTESGFSARFWPLKCNIFIKLQ